MFRIYLSGPITGTDDYMERFEKAENDIGRDECFVVNPAKVNALMPGDMTYDEYMKMSFTMLDVCDGIYLLKGWEQSKGACMEYGYAYAMGKIVFVEGENEPV